MKLRPTFILMLLASIGLLVIAIEYSRLHSMQRQLDGVQSQLLQTRHHASEMKGLAALRPKVSTGRKPTEDALAQINETLRDAGLDAKTLQGLTPQSDRPSTSSSGMNSTSSYRVQSLRLNLTNLTLPQFGAFLHHWRQRNNLWIPARIEMNIADERRRGTTSIQDTPNASYDITLHLEARYLDESPTSGKSNRPGASS